jgi:hypothetical protein
MKMEKNVPKRRHINSRRRVITQKKAYHKQFINTVDELWAEMILRETSEINTVRMSPTISSQTDNNDAR